jgi:hypothetical protein
MIVYDFVLLPDKVLLPDYKITRLLVWRPLSNPTTRLCMRTLLRAALLAISGYPSATDVDHVG